MTFTKDENGNVDKDIDFTVKTVAKQKDVQTPAVTETESTEQPTVSQTTSVAVKPATTEQPTVSQTTPVAATAVLFVKNVKKFNLYNLLWLIIIL